MAFLFQYVNVLNYTDFQMLNYSYIFRVNLLGHDKWCFLNIVTFYFLKFGIEFLCL